jgi:hypothetical protein
VQIGKLKVADRPTKAILENQINIANSPHLTVGRIKRREYHYLITCRRWPACRSGRGGCKSPADPSGIVITVSTRCCEGREEREEEDGWHLLLDAERLRRDVQHLLVVVGVGVPCQHRRRCRRHSQREEQEQQRH